MSTTKVPNFLVSPLPPSASETTTALDTKLNITDYNTALTSVNNRLDTLENKTSYLSFPDNSTNNTKGLIISPHGTNEGGQIVLNTPDTTVNPNNFVIDMYQKYFRVFTSDGTKIFRIYFGDELYSDIDGKVIETINEASVGQNGYIRYYSGLQLVWGQVQIPQSTASSGASVTYSKSFKSIPRVFVQIAYINGPYSYAMTEQTTTRSTTGCKIFVSKWNGTSMVWDNGYVDYLAIGHWK